ncbi:MAG: HAMP domain-containing sensor histidine kinase [Prosthecobacter sp.]
MHSLKAQAPDETLTKVPAVLALPNAVAEAGTKKVRLQGVVVEVAAKGEEFSLHDGEACLSVMVAGEASAPEVGDKVEIEGSVFSETFLERKRTRIKASKLTALGTAPLPEAKPVSIGDAATFKHLDQWVSVEGTVLQVRSSMSLLTIQMASGSASCNVLIRQWPRTEIPRDWIGGRVRVVGVNRAYLPGSNFLSVVATSQTQVTVLKTGVIDPLEAPLSTVNSLRESIPSKDERVKLTGTLLGATTGNVFYARSDDGGAFSFYMLLPIDEDKSGRFSTPIIMPKCNPGDVLEVVGIPSRVKKGVHLDFGVVRVLRSVSVPAATITDIATVAAGKLVHDLVEFEGRLLSQDDVLIAPGRWRTTMKLGDGEQTIIAFLDASSRGTVTHFGADNRLRVRGIVTAAYYPEIRVWVPTPSDAQSLGVATEVVTRRLWIGLAIAAGIVILLIGWAFMLYRSRRAVHDLNASLESRVTERTAELAAAKDDLVHALSQERELGELKSRFVSLVSHEFRTPLGIIMSAVEVLRHYGERITPEKHSELHEDIHSSTLQMSSLMEQVLMLGRAEAGKIGWKPAQVDLKALFERLVDEGLSATNRRCPVTFSTEGDFDGAMMDESLVRHIIGNLLSNAVKYSPEGSPVVLTLRREGEEAVITMQDHGIGIPKVDQAKLFEAFHRASNVGETPGTGLGLLLVKHCVDLHRGSLQMQSEEGVGTTFTVRLPLVSAVA